MSYLNLSCTAGDSATRFQFVPVVSRRASPAIQFWLTFRREKLYRTPLYAARRAERLLVFRLRRSRWTLKNYFILERFLKNVNKKHSKFWNILKIQRRFWNFAALEREIFFQEYISEPLWFAVTLLESL